MASIEEINIIDNILEDLEEFNKILDEDLEEK